MRAAITVILTAFVVTVSASAGPTTQCFFNSQFENWKAANPRTIYISVRPNRIYRLDLTAACPLLLGVDPRLLTVSRTISVCTPTDWDIRVSEGAHGPSEPCIVKAMSELSPAQVAALPLKDKPAF